MNGSITEMIKRLKNNHDLNEDAYKRFKQHVFWFVYFLPSIVGTLILWEFVKTPSLKALLAVGLIIVLHLKIKNHMYQTAKLYTVGEKTEGELLKGSYYYHKTGLNAVCAFKTPHDNKQHKLTTIFHDCWAGNVWKIKLVGNEEKILREDAQKNSFSCSKYVQLLIGKKVHILYLPNNLPKPSLSQGSSGAVWNFFSIKPSGFTLYCSDVAKCYCLSKQRYAQHLSTIELRAHTDKAKVKQVSFFKECKDWVILIYFILNGLAIIALGMLLLLIIIGLSVYFQVGEIDINKIHFGFSE